MRPLPDLTPLAPFQDVYDPATDDFTQLLADQPQTLDELQGLLDPPADQALSDIDLLAGAIDDLGTFSDACDQTFTQIGEAMEAVDYTETINVVVSLENDFYDSLGSFDPSAQPAIDQILNYILTLLYKLILWIIQGIELAIEVLAQWVWGVVINAIGGSPYWQPLPTPF